MKEKIPPGIPLIQAHKMKDEMKSKSGRQALRTCAQKRVRTPAATVADLNRQIMEAAKVLEAIGDGVSIQDRKYRILYENQAHRSLMGLHVGEYCYKAYQGNRGVCKGCPVAVAFRDGNVHTVQRELKTDSVTKYVEITASPLKDAEGNIIAGIEIVRDITETMRMKEALKESENLYRTLAEHALIGIWHITLHGHTLYANPAMCVMLEIDHHQELEEKTYHQFFTPESLTIMKREHAKRKRGIGSTYEVEIVGKRGRRRNVVVSGAPVFSAERKLQGLIGTFTDITERKMHEEALRRGEEKIRLLLNSTAEAIYGLDLEGKCTFCNPACLRLLGYRDAGELIGKHVHALIHHTKPDGKPYPEVECRIHQAFQKRKQIHVDNEVLWRSDGTSFSAEYWSYPVLRGNEVVGAVVTFLDISDRKRMEEELLLNKDRISSLYKLSQFTDASAQEVIAFALEEAIRLSGSRVGYLHFMHEDQVNLELFIWSKEVYKDCSAEKVGIYPLDKAGVWADCARLRKPVVHNDYQYLKERKGYPKGHVHTANHLSIPVFDGERIVAIAGVGNKAGDYNDADILQLNLFMNEMWRILQRKRSEEKIRESEKRYRALYEGSRDGYAMVDMEGRITEVNSTFSEMLGYTEAELRGKTYKDITPVQWHAMEMKILEEQVFVRGYSEVYEKEYVRKDGSVFPIELRTYLVKDKEGRHRSMWAFVRDITSRKRVAQTLTEREQQIRNIIEHSNELFYSHDIHHRLTYISPQSFHILGYTPEELMIEWTNLVTDNPLNEIGIDVTETAIRTGKKQPPYLLELFRKDGSRVLLEIDESPVKDSKGNVTGIVGAARDITERARAEQALQKSDEELKKRMRELEDFYEIAIGRELRMIELKEEIDRLKGDLERYREGSAP